MKQLIFFLLFCPVFLYGQKNISDPAPIPEKWTTTKTDTLPTVVLATVCDSCAARSYSIFVVYSTQQNDVTPPAQPKPDRRVIAGFLDEKKKPVPTTVRIWNMVQL